MELFGHFKYGSKESREFGLVFANIETDREHRLAGNIETSSVFSKRGIRNHFARDEYSDSPMSFDVEIVSDGDIGLEHSVQRTVEKWLFYSKSYQKLYIDLEDDPYAENYELVDGEPKRLYLNCRFTHPEVIEGSGGIYGYKATLEMDSPLAWQDAITKAFDIEDATNGELITVNVDSDLNDYIYPKVTIQTGNTGGNITIFNNADSATRLTSFTGLSANTQVVMTGEIGYISGQNYGKFSNKNFIRLLDGSNPITLIGDIASIQFEWQNRRYFR